MTQYPRIRFAALEIFYDNGMVNRTTTEAELLDEAYKRIKKKYTNEQLRIVEEELAQLSDAELNQLCCGAKEDSPTVTDTTDRLLNLLFEDDES